MPQKIYNRYRVLTRAEIAICGRVRWVRKDLKLTQVAFAKALKVSRDTIANIEIARVPLFAPLGAVLCERYLFCQRWLATGKGPKRPWIQVLQAAVPAESEGFLEYYRDNLEAPVSARLTEHAVELSCSVEELDHYWGQVLMTEERGEPSYAEKLKIALAKRVSQDLENLTDQQAQEYFSALLIAAQNFMTRHPRKGR